MKNLLAFAAIVGIALAAVAVDLDNDGRADIIVPTTSVATVIEPAISVRDNWAVRDGWRGAYDWNGDGVIDWRDDFLVGGVTPWHGDYVRADWNRDGVIDGRDGWRRFGETWATGSWDPTWRGEGWRPETVSVREVPAGVYTDSDWNTVEGPWETFGWGGSFVADWNRDGVIDWKDDLAWRGGFRGAVVEEFPAVRGTAFTGAPAFGERFVGAPAFGERVVGAPVVGERFVGAPAFGERVVGAPVIGAGAVGAPVVATPHAGATRVL